MSYSSNPSRRKEMAAARAAERAAERLRPLPQLPKELGPGQRLHTRLVLAGAYRGRDLDYRSTLSHAVLMDGDRDVRLLCSSRVDIADEYSSTPEQGAQPPTCPRCLVAWGRMQSYWIWVIGGDERPLDVPQGPHKLLQAGLRAARDASGDNHDRAVSVGKDPTERGFSIVQRYRHGTGERVL